MLVWVVDDDPNFVAQACRGLSAQGLQVVPWEDGASCVVALSAEGPPPDLILLDIFLTGIDGVQLVAMIRAHPRGKSLKILAVADRPSPETLQRALAAGANGSVNRPISVTDIAVWALGGFRQDLDAPKLKRARIGVLYADLRGFTAFSRQHDPETVADVLTALFDIFVSDIEAAGGFVDKILGDGVLALFGAPRVSEDPVRQVVAAARELRAHSIAFIENSVLLAGRSTLTGVGTGVAFGEAVVGLMGPKGRKGFTAIGDVVNLAARLQGLAGPGEILLGPRAAAAIEGRVDLGAPRETMLKGLGSVQVYPLRTD